MTIRVIASSVRIFVIVLSAALFAAVPVPPSGAAQTDPLIGIWKFDAARSTFTPGPAPFRSLTLNFSVAAQGLRNDVQGVDSDGKPITTVFTIVPDGQFYPVTGAPDFDSSAWRRVDANTTEYSRRRNGQVVITGTRVLSANGRLLTFTEKGTHANGQQYSAVAIYNKQ